MPPPEAGSYVLQPQVGSENNVTPQTVECDEPQKKVLQVFPENSGKLLGHGKNKYKLHSIPANPFQQVDTVNYLILHT